MGGRASSGAKRIYVSWLAETTPYFLRQGTGIPANAADDHPNYPGATPDFRPTVSFTTAGYEVHAKGTAYRMDNVPITLRALRATDLPTEKKLLEDLRRAC
jgi:formylmethanofuran dehydrogenase subunit B